jgi:hypothetical protein
VRHAAGFCLYIHPILEYNSVLWNPCYICPIDSIENVQRNFTKRVPSLSLLPYFALDLQPLELRKLRFDLIFYFKISNNLTPFDPNEMFIMNTPIMSSRSGSYY